MTEVNPREILQSYDQVEVNDVMVEELDIHMEYAGCSSHQIELTIKGNASDLLTLRDFIDGALRRKAKEVLMEREERNAGKPE